MLQLYFRVFELNLNLKSRLGFNKKKMIGKFRKSLLFENFLHPSTWNKMKKDFFCIY